MAFDADCTNVNSVDDLQKNHPAAGKYHVLIKNVDTDRKGVKDKIIIKYEVITGTMPGQEGKEKEEWYSTDTDMGRRQLTHIAMILGLIRPGEKKLIDFEKAIGEMVIIEFVLTEGKPGTKNAGKKFLNVGKFGFGIWPIGHEDVKDIPVDHGFVARRNGARQVVAQAEASMAQAETTAAVNAGAKDTWDTL